MCIYAIKQLLDRILLNMRCCADHISVFLKIQFGLVLEELSDYDINHLSGDYYDFIDGFSRDPL